MTIAANVLKEKTRRKDFYIIAALGISITLLISSSTSSISIAGEPVTSFSGLFPIVVAFINIIACALAVALSISTIPNEYKRQTSHLVWVRGVSQLRYHAGLALGNIAASVLSALVLYIGVALFILVKGQGMLMPRLAVGFLISCIPVCLCSIAASVFSIKLPYTLAGIASIGFLLLGTFHPLLSTLCNMISGFAGGFLRVILAAVPNLFSMHSQASSFVLGNGADLHVIAQGLLFIYLFSILLILFKQKQA